MNRYLMMHRICKILGIEFYYENQYGIKEFNKHLFKLKKSYDKEEYIRPNDILLGFDGLKDKYTLIGVPIEKSPHFELLKLLKENKTIDKCNYVYREKNGILDGRNKLKIDNHKQIFEAMKKKVQDENYEAVYVYKIDNDYYAFDGKHRLAMCALYEINCKCICFDLSELINDTHTRKLYKQMLKKKDYNKNISVLNKIFNTANYK